MNENDFDLAARAWLDDGPNRMSDHGVLSTLEEIHTTRQRRPMRPAWRATPVSIFPRLAAAAVLVVAVGFLADYVIPRQSDRSNVGGPSPSAVQALDFPVLTTTFVSPRNGFSVDYPDRGEGILTPATNLFGLGDDGFDVIETGLSAAFKGASTAMPPVENGFLVGEPSDISIDEWVDSVIPDGGCKVPHREWAEITIDGLPGRIVECPGTIMATVVDDAAPQPRSAGRLYLFTLLHDRTDGRAVFDAFASTIDLTPETVVDLPGLTSTYVSATNGFSVNYNRGLVPARKLWDPVNEPPFDTELLWAGGAAPTYGFDEFDTGFSAVFLGASTKVPDGVSLDEWVDATVARWSFRWNGSPCAPRSQQPEISIDGQSGRICADDPEVIAATVVVDGRLYLFTLLHQRQDARALFDAFVDTIDLRPQDAAVPSSTSSS